MIKKIFYLTLVLIALISQYNSTGGGEWTFGYPWNYINYNAKFDTYHLFFERLIMTSMFWLLICLAVKHLTGRVNSLK